MRPPVEQQYDRIASRSVGVAAIVALLVGAAGILLSTALLRAHGWFPRRGTSKAAPLEIGVVEQTPIDDAHGATDLQRKQRAELSRYRWVGDDHRVATIPIDRAMRIVAEKKR